MAMKKVGGPGQEGDALARHECQGLFGVEAAHQHRAQAGGARHEDPVEQPEMWAIGAGIRTASAGPRPCTRAISDAFQLRPRWVCRTALGTPVEPEVKRTSATSEGRLGEAPDGTGGAADGLGERHGVGKGVRLDLQLRAPGRSGRGPLSRRRRRTSAGPGAATAPMRQQARVRTAAARLLGTCQATAWPRRTPRGSQSAGDHRHECVGLGADRRVAPSTTSPPCAVSRASSVGTSQGRRAGGSGGPARAPRSVGGGPSRQGTIPGPR